MTILREVFAPIVFWHVAGYGVVFGLFYLLVTV